MVSIRTATIEDLDAILQIENESLALPWSRILFEADLATNPNALYFVAEEDGSVLGFVGTHNIVGEINITNVAVSPIARNKKIGSMLISAVIDHFEALGEELVGITLEVRVSNAPAIALYKKYSFVEEGLRKHYYSDGEDAIIMWRRNSSRKQI